MNQKIKEFEKQCWSHRVDGTLVDGQLHFDTKKFAELIVQECLNNMKNCDGDLDFAIWKTKKDFEVEE